MSRTALVLALLLAVIVSARFIDAQTQPVAGLTSVAISAGTTGPPSLFPSGTAARPGISFAADPTTGLYLFSAGNLVGDTGGANVFLLNTAGFAMISTGLYRWTGGDALQSVDTGLGRSAAGVVEINNGTAGQRASLTTNNGGAIIHGAVTFATLNVNVANGTQVFCSDCAAGAIDVTCTGGGTGAMAFRINGVWRCLS